MNVHQTELICAILGELDRQHPGATLIQDQMNAIIAAADQIVATLRDGRDARIMAALDAPVPAATSPR